MGVSINTSFFSYTHVLEDHHRCVPEKYACIILLKWSPQMYFAEEKQICIHDIEWVNIFLN